ncbi:ExeM/NucH family extracellular endonuclease [Tessaracoccus sp. Y36]
MRKHLTVLAATAALLAASFVAAPAQAVPADHLVINEVYARGGSANQPFNKKFVELYNPTAQAIDLTGWKLGYSSATTAGVGSTCGLSGTVAPGGFFVVGTGTNNATVGADVSVQLDCGINPSGTNGAITLLNGDVEIDIVGYGTAVRNETAAAIYTGGNSTPGSITRTGASDTDNNAEDFDFTETPTPGSDSSITGGGTPTPTPTETTTVPTEPTVTPIAEIQGPGAATPLSGQTVTTTGVVTAAYPTGNFRGAYIQTPGSGGAPKAPGDASDGIFVFGDAAANATIGECYTVTGTAGEHFTLTQLANATLTPAADCAAVTPTALTTFPGTDAAKEAYEGMLVLPTGGYTITNNYDLNRYGQIGLAYGDEPLFTATDVVRPGPEALAYEAENRTKLITLDDGSSWDYTNNAAAKNSPLPHLSAATPMRTGSPVTFTEPVILDYRFQWNFQPTSQVTGAEVSFITSVNDRPADAPVVGGDIQLASFNVLNYFDDLGVNEANCKYYSDREGNPVGANNCQVRGAYSESAFADQEAKIVAAINKLDADVVGLQEIENSAAITYLAGQPRDKALATLVAALNAAGGNWAFAPSPTVATPNEDVIRTAFIYNPDTVQLVGPSYILLDDAFANARNPLAQEFQAKGSTTTFVAIVNHFKSKGSGEDDGTGQGNANPSREAQAKALSTWANTFEAFADKPVFLMGDFNAYTMETPVQFIEDAGFTNLTQGGVTEDATYQFSGRLGSLDHVFANDAALALVTDAAVWNINGDESIAFQYSRRNYNITDFHAVDEFASSDHDPVVVGIKAPQPDVTSPMISDLAHQKLTVGRHFSLQVQATDDSADLTYSVLGNPAWLTIDADGTLSGTPTGPRSYKVTIRVSDPAGNTSSDTVLLQVKPKTAAQPPVRKR